MGSNNTKPIALRSATETSAQLCHDWFDPIEMGVRAQVRGFIEGMIEAELETVLSRPRYGRPTKTRDVADNVPAGLSGHRHGHRSRSLMGTFGQVQISVPRARLMSADGKTSEWKSKTLPAYQRRTRAADAPIAGAYLSGTNTRRVRRALAALFGGAAGKDVVSRVWRKVQGDWEAWNNRSLTDEPIVRLILDGTVVRVRLDKKATSISLLVVLGVREDGQKVLLAVKNMGGETKEAWRAVLDDLVKRGLRRPGRGGRTGAHETGCEAGEHLARSHRRRTGADRMPEQAPDRGRRARRVRRRTVAGRASLPHAGQRGGDASRRLRDPKPQPYLLRRHGHQHCEMARQPELMPKFRSGSVAGKSAGQEVDQ